MRARAASSFDSHMATARISEHPSLVARTAVVTGASRGIGLAVATALVRAGVRTYMLARNDEKLVAAAATLGKLAMPHRCDVSDAAHVRDVVAAITTELAGAPDVLVNNAGLFPLAP